MLKYASLQHMPKAHWKWFAKYLLLYAVPAFILQALLTQYIAKERKIEKERTLPKNRDFAWINGVSGPPPPQPPPSHYMAQSEGLFSPCCGRGGLGGP